MDTEWPKHHVKPGLWDKLKLKPDQVFEYRHSFKTGTSTYCNRCGSAYVKLDKDECAICDLPAGGRK
jgi:hypothetical protein